MIKLFVSFTDPNIEPGEAFAWIALVVVAFFIGFIIIDGIICHFQIKKRPCSSDSMRLHKHLTYSDGDSLRSIWIDESTATCTDCGAKWILWNLTGGLACADIYDAMKTWKRI